MSRLYLSPAARLALGDNDEQQLDQRARALDVYINAGRNYRGGYWKVAIVGQTTTELQGRGPLAAVIAGALDDFEAVAA